MVKKKIKSKILTINKIASTSDLMEVEIIYNGKRHRFNLYDELQIKEAAINTNLKTHASSYAFLTMLLAKMLELKKEVETRRKKTYGHLYMRYKDELKSGNGRPISDDATKIRIEANSRYVEKTKELNSIENTILILQNCVRSFEIKQTLLQSLSANIRNEK